MLITRIEAFPVEMRLNKDYRGGNGSGNLFTNIFIRIITNSKITGLGCAAPNPSLTEETSHSVQLVIEGIIAQVARGFSPLRIAKLLEKLKPHLQKTPCALAALDMALHDILAKQAGLPLWKLLGGFRNRIKTSAPIGSLPVAESLALAKEWVNRGLKCLKIFGGSDCDTDIERVLKIREIVGPRFALRFDAKQGYSLPETLRFAQAIKSAKLEFIEQPTTKSKPEILSEVTRKVSLPVVADESLTSPKEALRLTHEIGVDMLNIKTNRIGGISIALQLNAIAKSSGAELVVESEEESVLGIAAGLHFALARPNVAYADLGSFLNLIDDPAKSAATFRNGFLYPGKEAGLGVRF